MLGDADDGKAALNPGLKAHHQLLALAAAPRSPDLGPGADRGLGTGPARWRPNAAAPLSGGVTLT